MNFSTLLNANLDARMPCDAYITVGKDHFRAKIRVVLSKLCRKFGFEEIKGLMPEQDKKLVSHMQTTAERELKAKKARLNPGGDGGGEDNAKAVRRGRADSSRDGERGITKALRAFDSMMEGKYWFYGFLCVVIF